MNKIFIYSALAVFILDGCTKSEVESIGSITPKEEIVTGGVQKLTVSTATLVGEYSEKTDKIISKGFVVSLDEFAPESEVVEYSAEGIDSGEFTYLLEELKLGQKYSYKAYIKRSSGQKVYGDVCSFYPDDFAILPASEPEGAIHLDYYNAISAHITVPNLGTDKLFGLDVNCVRVARIGIRYWLDGEQEQDAHTKELRGEDVYNCKPTENVIVEVAELKKESKYHYRLFIDVGIFNFPVTEAEPIYMPTVESEPCEFETGNLLAPAISNAVMSTTGQEVASGIEYSYRSATTDNKLNISTNYAVIKFKLTQGNDRSLKYGVKWGTSNVEGNANYLNNDIPADNINSNTGVFSVKIENGTASPYLIKPGTTYYVQPYASNAEGDAPYTDIHWFTTAVDGGKQYQYAGTNSGNYSFQKMLANGSELIYLELDPVRSGNNTYYLLDRNLGADRPFTEATYRIQPTNAATNQPQDLNAIGYYWQWGLATPSAVPNMAANAPANPASWAGNSSNAVTHTTDQQWPSDPCPTGYIMPSSTQWMAIYNGLTKKDMPSLFASLRLGLTATRNATGGTQTAAAFNYWVSDSGGNTTLANGFRLADNGGTLDTTPTFAIPLGLYAALPIRCVKVVTSTD